ncbi:hypothetical protein CDD82_4268 [Ophiocordyceps australis]|uniref:Uncharacterized protein n=1 Tax=Ophiocordyceps australis TaxID=1399860 RepID=A0A2C5ZLT3_9HYPO|nr:hypothetical protein CDD82_4268 [Ophiocordyceps australis]
MMIYSERDMDGHEAFANKSGYRHSAPQQVWMQTRRTMADAYWSHVVRQVAAVHSQRSTPALANPGPTRSSRLFQPGVKQHATQRPDSPGSASSFGAGHTLCSVAELTLVHGGA